MQPPVLSRTLPWTLAVAMALCSTSLVARQASAQQPAPAAGTAKALDVGAMAPDFALPAASRYGRLAAPVKLSDFRGETVVLAFFFKARTRG